MKIELQSQRIFAASDFLRKADHFSPGEDLREPLQTALQLPLSEAYSDVTDQMLKCIGLLSDYLPRRVYLNLLAEAGIASMLTSPPSDMQNHPTSGIRNVLVQKDFPDAQFASHVMKVLEQAINFMTMRPYHDGFSLLDYFAPVVNLTDPVADRRFNAEAIADELAQTSLIFLNKGDFFRHIPGGKLIEAIYGESFWVQDLPLCNTLVFTDAGYPQLSKHKPLLYSNLIHELAGHSVLSISFNINVHHKNGQPIDLDANLVLPDWFKEGLANMPALRFAANVEGMTNFLDLFLQKWDGKIPSSKELLAGDTNISYFFYTLFTAFSLQTLMRPRLANESEFTLTDMGNFKQIMQAIAILRNASHIVDFELPDHAGDITQLYLEAMYNTASDFLSTAYPQKYAKRIDFVTICDLFDEHKEKYTQLWLERHATLSQKAKIPASSSQMNTIPNDTLRDPSEEYTLNRNIDIGTHDPELMHEILKMFNVLGLGKSKAEKDVRDEIEQCWAIVRYLPAKTFQRLLSEAHMAMITNPENENRQKQIEITRHNITHQLFRPYWQKAHADVKDRVSERGIDVIGEFFSDGPPLVGVFSMGSSFDQQLAKDILYRHFDMLLSSRQKLFSDKNTPFEYPGRKSFLELLSMVSTETPEKLFQILTSQNYVFMPINQYYERIPYLQNVDYPAFWVREHPITGTLLYTDRAIRFKEQTVLGGDSSRHESLGHTIQAAVLPVRVRFPDSPYVYDINSGLVLRTWFHEGTANIISGRFIDNYRDFVDFWKLAAENLGDPASISIPQASEIISADTKLPYLFHTLFCSFVLQTIGEKFSHISTNKFPKDPDQFKMMRGYFMILHASNRAEPFILPLNPSDDIGQLYLLYLLDQTAAQYGLDLASFQEICEAFDKHKDDYWQKWQEKFQPT